MKNLFSQRIYNFLNLLIFLVLVLVTSCKSEGDLVDDTSIPEIVSTAEGYKITVLIDFRDRFKGDGRTDDFEYLKMVGKQFKKFIIDSKIKVNSLNHYMEILTIPDYNSFPSLQIVLTKQQNDDFKNIDSKLDSYIGDMKELFSREVNGINAANFDLYDQIKNKVHIYNDTKFKQRKLIIITSGIVDDPLSNPVVNNNYPNYHSYLKKENVQKTKGLIPHNSFNLSGLEVLVVGVNDIDDSKGNKDRELSDKLHSVWKKWFVDMGCDSNNVDVVTNSISGTPVKIENFLKI